MRRIPRQPPYFWGTRSILSTIIKSRGSGRPQIQPRHLNWYIYGTTPFKPGDIRLADLNHDGVISADSDRTYIGSAVPKWSLGFQNTFIYKGFDLTVYMIVRWGQMIDDAALLGNYNPTGQGNNAAGLFQLLDTLEPLQ